MADANWNHEVCAIAYSYEGVPQQAAEARANFDKGTQALIAATRNNGGGDEDVQRAVEMREQQRAMLEQRIAEVEAEAARHLPNIPKCKGQFFRPALESLCNFTAGENRFCGQLQNGPLPGVELIEDKLEFAHGLAWNKVGHLFSQGVAFKPEPWKTAFKDGAKEAPRYGMAIREDGTYYFETENGPRVPLNMENLLFHLRDARENHVASAATGGITFIYANNAAVKEADGSELGGSPGRWAFSLEMVRRPKAEADAATLSFASEMSRASGLVTDLAEYVQLPRIHFQAYMFDVLVQSDIALLAVEMRDGTRHELSEPAWFQPSPDGSPTFYSSFQTYRIHAAMMPSEADMRALLSPDAAYLSARFEMLLEDGTIDVVTLRTPLAGMNASMSAMNAANLELRGVIRATAKEWDDRIAAKEAEFAEVRERRERERAAALAKAEEEIRTFLGENGFARNCGSLPSGVSSSNAGEVNRRAQQVQECDRAWVQRARAAKEELNRLQRNYSALGGSDSLAKAELARWDAALDARNADFDRFNREVSTHNARVAQNRQQAAAAASSRRSASYRRQESYTRRQRSNGSERSAADDFYEAQSRPYVPYFRDVTIPPKPTGYMGTGYW